MHLKYPGSDREQQVSAHSAHSSPKARPTLAAQRKPRLSEAESGVFPILPMEGEKEWMFVEQARGLAFPGLLVAP